MVGLRFAAAHPTRFTESQPKGGVSVLVRYTLRDFFWLHPIVLLSVGFVYVANVTAGAVFDCFGSTVKAIEDSIASMAGGLSVLNRTLFISVPLNDVVSGVLIAFAIVVLLLLRNSWTTLAAFSMPFGVLLAVCFKFWMIAAPVTTSSALLVSKSAIMPTLVAACLFSLFVYCKNRLSGPELGVEVAFSERPSWQRRLFAVACATYLLACVYGWYLMASFRLAMIEAQQYWEQLEQIYDF